MKTSKNILSEKEMELVSLLIQDCQSTGDIQTKLKRLFAGTIETMLEAKMEEHLGYEKHNVVGNNSGNSRNAVSEVVTDSEYESAKDSLAVQSALMEVSTDGSVETTTDGVIQNYLLWTGLLGDENGNPITYEYTDGKYVIVLEASIESNKKYNSFLAFEIDTNMNIFDLLPEEYRSLYSECAGDPVNLLTGSFTWDYTDFELYGKHNLPFTRYYESSDANRNHGLGYGWSTDYTIELEIDELYAHVTLPGGKDIYFDLYYDGTYRAKAGSAFSFTEITDGYQLIDVLLPQLNLARTMRRKS